jgi:hypothetical protein
MDSWGVAFLGVIALGSVVQTGFLIGMAVAARRLARRLDELQDRFERDIRPSIDNIARITRNLAEVSELAVVQGRRIDELMEDTVEKIEETTATLRRFVLRPLSPLLEVFAFLKGVQRALKVYGQLRGFDRRERSAPPRYSGEDDEHMFI